MSHFLLATTSLAQREVVRFFRQRSRVSAALATPLLFWLLIGSGFSSSFQLPGAPAGLDFRQYFFPGTMALVLLFAAIFATISVIEDRNAGFLQGVMVAPVPRTAVVAGKVLGGAALAWVQALLFLPLAPLAGVSLTAAAAAKAAGVMLLLAITLTAIGFAFAWMVDSTQGFHAVMNLVLMPMWLLSGAFFPLSGAPGWLSVLMRVNPMTYGVEALRAVLTGAPTPGAPPFALGLGVLAATAVVALAADLAVVRLRRA